MGALATQKVLLQKLVQQEKIDSEVKNVFPIKSIEDLNALNDEISEDNRQAHVILFS